MFVVVTDWLGVGALPDALEELAGDLRDTVVCAWSACSDGAPSSSSGGCLAVAATASISLAAEAILPHSPAVVLASPNATSLFSAALPVNGAARPQAGVTQALAPQRPPLNTRELLFKDYFDGAMVAHFTIVEGICFGAALLLSGAGGLVPSICTLYKLGAAWGPAIAGGAVWRLLAPVFLHANLGHYAANALVQMRFGYTLEKHLGSKGRFAALYLLSGFFGNLYSTAVDPMKLAVGASTSGLGLIGASAVMVAIDWETMTPETRRTIMLPVVIIATLACVSSGDMNGHFGGLVSGACLMTLLSPVKEGHVLPLARTGAAAILLGALTGCSWSLHNLSEEMMLEGAKTVFC
eukprot:TRINITY_DN30460_c0_g1_i1.p1 TRINITY_DN30460_c0_g1~~TRINITY_DN30460_c0_g1_i1.p1  ORF type:complete len:376 (-),score=68.50 TRINITY_DN30460_c0_g1_i1:94-1149(-)